MKHIVIACRVRDRDAIFNCLRDQLPADKCIYGNALIFGNVEVVFVYPELSKIRGLRPLYHYIHDYYIDQYLSRSGSKSLRNIIDILETIVKENNKD